MVTKNAFKTCNPISYQQWTLLWLLSQVTQLSELYPFLAAIEYFSPLQQKWKAKNLSSITGIYITGKSC